MASPGWNHQQGDIGEQVKASSLSRKEEDTWGRAGAGIGEEAYHIFLHREWHRPRKLQIPPDLVVKFQPIDIIDVIL
jgi:hypothetical protein